MRGGEGLACQGFAQTIERPGFQDGPCVPLRRGISSLVVGWCRRPKIFIAVRLKLYVCSRNGDCSNLRTDCVKTDPANALMCVTLVFPVTRISMKAKERGRVNKPSRWTSILQATHEGRIRRLDTHSGDVVLAARQESRLVPSVEFAVLYRSRQLEVRYMRIHAQLEDGMG